MNAEIKLSQSDCNVCLNGNSDIIEIFGKHGVSLNACEILNKYFWFKWNSDVKENPVICSICWEKVSDFHVFYTEVYEKHFNNKLIKFEPTEHKEEPDESYHDHYQGDPPSLDTSDESDDDEERDPVFVSFPYSEDIKDENTSNLDEDELDDLPISLRKKLKKPSVDKLKPVEPTDDCADDQSSDSQNESSNKTTKTKTKVKTTQKKKSNKNTDAESTEDIEVVDQKITSHFVMECDLCPMKFSSYGNVKSHYRILHEVEGYLKCCDKKFFRPNSLIEHINWHKTPDDFKCMVCEKSFTRKYTLRKHQENQHRPLTSPEKLPFQCAQCPKTFPSKMKVRRHAIVVHGERKFVCDKCGFRFTNKSALNTHKNLHENHLNPQHICDVCGHFFNSSHQMTSHKIRVHVTKRLQCTECGLWLKNGQVLKMHMARHEDRKIEITCDICGQKCATRKALYGHKMNIHVTIPKHECTICGKKFKRPIRLREHIATHTGVDLYSCAYCSRTFKASAAMFAHRKREHPEEWLECRKQAKIYSSVE